MSSIDKSIVGLENMLTTDSTRLRAALVALLFVFTLLAQDLYAQRMSEDFAWVKAWKLPENATPLSDLEIRDDLLYDGEELFDGIAYQRYPEGTLLRASQYKGGKQNGLGMLWYPDGSPQMSASYRDGALHGRFLGWYQNGRTIYDMIINRGTYAADNLADEDQSRLRDEQETTEREGNTDDGTRE